jgi:hypothetical protein
MQQTGSTLNTMYSEFHKRKKLKNLIASEMEGHKTTNQINRFRERFSNLLKTCLN